MAKIWNKRLGDKICPLSVKSYLNRSRLTWCVCGRTSQQLRFICRFCTLTPLFTKQYQYRQQNNSNCHGCWQPWLNFVQQNGRRHLGDHILFGAQTNCTSNPTIYVKAVIVTSLTHDLWRTSENRKKNSGSVLLEHAWFWNRLGKLRMNANYASLGSHLGIRILRRHSARRKLVFLLKR